MRAILRTAIGLWLLQLGAVAFAQLGWSQLPGAARDIGVGPRSGVWVIGNDNDGSGNFGIYQKVGSGWQKVPGSAVRIDVGPSADGAEIPWVVNAAGGIYRYTFGKWHQLPGGARDIGIGANNAVWVIGTNPEVGGYGIYRFNHGSQNWDKIPGSAVRIDVDPQGNAWVVTSGNAIFRYNGSGFVQMPGAATDIGIGANGTVYVVGTDGRPYLWNGSNWVQKDGVLASISVDPAGKPYGVNPGYQIFAASVGSGGAYTPPANPTTPVAPPAPPRKGVVVVNKSPSHAWITIYSEAAWVRTIRASGCLKPQQEHSWADVPIVEAAGGLGEKIIVRVERTSTANCASLPGNRHVTCDTSASWDKLGGLESAAYFRKPWVAFEFNDGCYINVDR